VNSKQARFSNIFVVIDPTRMVQSALIKAEAIARLNGAKLLAYCCIFDAAANASAKTREASQQTTRSWLERLVAAPRSEGLTVDIRLEWNENWRHALVDAASGSNCDLIVKASSKHSAVGRMLAATSDWMLLRRAAAPTLLVSDAPLPESDRKLLAAVKLKPEDPLHEQLNERIVEMGHYIADAAQFELHAVTAYKGKDVYYDRQRFADSCRLPRNRVHSVEGAPQFAIAEAARDVGADTIIIGDPADSETAQRLIDHVDADVLVLPAGEAA
jgi:nucleotide-binding universal stress UspA family protein